MKRAVVLLSGGVDSTTTLAVAASEGYDELYALSFDYGQRHKIELTYARENADRYHAKKHLIIKFNLRDIGGSALTSDIEVPKDRTQNTEHRTQTTKNRDQNTEHRDQTTENRQQTEDDIPVTYVPARNTIFLSFALAWAETLEAGDIYIGANAVDYSGYPDCRPEFIHAFEEMANLATKVSVEGKVKFRIRAPLIELSKAEILKKGKGLGVDYHRTWSCYDPVREKGGYRPCGQCDSCRLRAKGFREAGMNE